MADYDVIIAGAGTGGANTAYTLAKRGHSVLLVDRKERDDIGNKTCGDALGSHHIKELRDLVGIPELPEGIVEYEVNGIDLIAPDRDHSLRMAGPTTTGMGSMVCRTCRECWSRGLGLDSSETSGFRRRQSCWNQTLKRR
jgi:flavin-dependent dehydrogenase